MAAGKKGKAELRAGPRPARTIARRYRPARAAEALTAGEDAFARALAARCGDGAPQSLGPGDLAADDLAAAFRAAWPGRARRFRPATIADRAAALAAAPRLQGAISHYRAERAAAPARLDWAKAERAQAAHRARQRLGLGVREIDGPVDRGTPETRGKLRADVIRKLHRQGHLRDEHVAAAEEISRLVLAFMRGLFPSSRPLDGTRGGGAKRAVRRYLDPADRLSLWEARQWSQAYAPWSREMGAEWVACRRGRLNRLGLVWAVVLDNAGPR